MQAGVDPEADDASAGRDRRAACDRRHERGDRGAEEQQQHQHQERKGDQLRARPTSARSRSGLGDRDRSDDRRVNGHGAARDRLDRRQRLGGLLTGTQRSQDDHERLAGSRA
jgi:hypothetical protein